MKNALAPSIMEEKPPGRASSPSQEEDRDEASQVPRLRGAMGQKGVNAKKQEKPSPRTGVPCTGGENLGTLHQTQGKDPRPKEALNLLRQRPDGRRPGYKRSRIGGRHGRA